MSPLPSSTLTLGEKAAVVPWIGGRGFQGHDVFNYLNARSVAVKSRSADTGNNCDVLAAKPFDTNRQTLYVPTPPDAEGRDRRATSPRFTGWADFKYVRDAGDKQKPTTLRKSKIYHGSRNTHPARWGGLR